MSKQIDITDERFGRLTAKHATEERCGGSVIWKCCCDCGNTTHVSVDSLRRGNTNSCGCIRKETAAERNSKDISEQQFGRLTAKYPTSRRRSRSVIWFCKCECGNTALVPVIDLMNSHTKSCGCFFTEQHIGSNNHNWNSELTDEDREGRRIKPQNRNWIRQVFERDNYTCQKCGQVGGTLNAHHKLNYSQYRELRYIVRNGITFCEKCHRDFHKLFGYKNNTPGQIWVYTIYKQNLEKK